VQPHVEKKWKSVIGIKSSLCLHPPNPKSRTTDESAPLQVNKSSNVALTHCTRKGNYLDFYKTFFGFATVSKDPIV
jgi:hypothetical protein